MRRFAIGVDVGGGVARVVVLSAPTVSPEGGSNYVTVDDCSDLAAPKAGYGKVRRPRSNGRAGEVSQSAGTADDSTVPVIDAAETQASLRDVGGRYWSEGLRLEGIGCAGVPPHAVSHTEWLDAGAVSGAISSALHGALGDPREATRGWRQARNLAGLAVPADVAMVRDVEANDLWRPRVNGASHTGARWSYSTLQPLLQSHAERITGTHRSELALDWMAPASIAPRRLTFATVCRHHVDARVDAANAAGLMPAIVEDEPGAALRACRFIAEAPDGPRLSGGRPYAALWLDGRSAHLWFLREGQPGTRAFVLSTHGVPEALEAALYERRAGRTFAQAIVAIRNDPPLPAEPRHFATAAAPGADPCVPGGLMLDDERGIARALTAIERGLGCCPVLFDARDMLAGSLISATPVSTAEARKSAVAFGLALRALVPAP
ncbi:MAG: hypothetical protein ACRYGG_11670 [Janthinobacterium lividum]